MKRMVKIKVTFTDGSQRTYEFSSKEKANYFLLNEGTNVRKVEYL